LEDRCPFCDSPLGRRAEFCSHCGRSIRTGESAKILSSTVIGKNRLGTASWSDLKRLFLFYFLIMGCSLTYGLADKILDLGPQLELVFMAVWIGLTALFLYLEWPKVFRAFRFRIPKLKTALQLLALCAAVFFFLQGYFWCFGYFGWPVSKMTESYIDAAWPLWSIYVMISVEPGIIEEIAFRGILQTRLSQILSKREAILIQAALFSVLHLSPAIFVSHFVIGLILGWVRFRTGTVYYGMLLHMSWNAFVAMQEIGKWIY
jgi:membrane protease YdiL (CAAX protease family)